MNVSLTPELEEFVEQKVRSGRYHSASEVISEGLRLLDDHDRDQDPIQEVRNRIQIGLDQLDRGEGIPGDKVYTAMKQRSAAFRRDE